MDDEDNHSVSGESSIDSWVNNHVDNDSANAILKSVLYLCYVWNNCFKPIDWQQNNESSDQRKSWRDGQTLCVHNR